METIYDRIEYLRKINKISQGELEKQLGFGNGSISKWKSHDPAPKSLSKLADYFDVSTDYLITGSTGSGKSNNTSKALALYAKYLSSPSQVQYIVTTLLDDDKIQWNPDDVAAKKGKGDSDDN